MYFLEQTSMQITEEREEKDIILCTSMARLLWICAIVHCQLRLQHGKLFSRGSDGRRTEDNSIREKWKQCMVHQNVVVSM